MKHGLCFILLFLYICLSSSKQISAAYWDTLPSNVRTLVYRQVFVPNVSGRFDEKQQYESYKLNFNLDSKTLHDAASMTRIYFDELKKISPEAYDAFSFGEFKGRADANINVSILGFGWGVTNYLTAYVYVPYYKADVRIDFKRTAGNNHQQVAQLIENAQDRNDVSTILSSVTEELFDVNERTLQSVVTNYFGYRPVGNWYASGFGDTELGLMYRLTNWDDSGLLASVGVTAPTGREDDPDTLQDVAFGDGQWDFFFEFGGGLMPYRFLGLESWIRSTYQMSYEKIIRLPESASFPLTTRKALTKVKLGSKFDWHLRLNLYPWDFLKFSPLYTFSGITKTRYESPYADANNILAQNTDVLAHQAGVTLVFSTIPFFKEKQFPLPLEIATSMLSIFAGKNTEQYTRYDLEMRFFF